MSKHISHIPHFMHHFKNLPPLKKQKSVIVSGLMGFLFGPVGIAIYFESISEGLICFGFLIMLALSGIGIPIAIIFGGIYGMLRAGWSNEKLGPDGKGAPPIIKNPVNQTLQVYLKHEDHECGPFSVLQVREMVKRDARFRQTTFRQYDGAPWLQVATSFD